MPFIYVPEDSVSIANYFIRKAAASGERLTPMKLVKLVYIAHGWHLGLTGRELISSPIEAWQYGPVIREIYHEFKRFGDLEISGETRVAPPIQDANVPSFLDSVWRVYHGFSAVQLSTLTHQPGTPWDITWNKNGGKNMRGAVIPTSEISAHYKQKAAKNNS